MDTGPLATGSLYGRTWTVHRAVAEGLGRFPSAYLEWSYAGETEVRQARAFAGGEDGMVWDRAIRCPQVAAAVALVKAEWVRAGGPEAAERAAAERRARAARLRVQAEAEGRRCFIRFGDLPASGCSTNHRGGIPEPGVSVYPAWHLPDGTFVIDLRGLDTISAVFIIDDRPVFEVTGTVLDVAGSDGEPLIADATARRVHPTAVETTI